MNFRPSDPKGNNADKIKHIKMKDNQCIAKYNVKFNHLTALTRYGDKPLMKDFYDGLPNHVKDGLALYIERPIMLAELCRRAHNVDL